MVGKSVYTTRIATCCGCEVLHFSDQFALFSLGLVGVRLLVWRELRSISVWSGLVWVLWIWFHLICSVLGLV